MTMCVTFWLAGEAQHVVGDVAGAGGQGDDFAAEPLGYPHGLG